MNKDMSQADKQRTIAFNHPGEILDEEFLKPMGISQYRLAQAISVPPRRINEICMANAPSRLIPPCGLAHFLAPMHNLG